MKYTVPQLSDILRTEADAYLFMEELRWGTGVAVCSHCGNDGATYIAPANGISRKTRTGAETQRRIWRCLACRKQFSVITGTVFHGTKVPLRTWVLVTFEMVSSKNGVSAREIERKYGVCPRTAWFVLHRVREAMANDALVETMRGTIVADETWIGGKPSNRHASATESPVRVTRVDMASSVLHTDSGVWYGPVGQEFASHESVNHAAGEYVRGDVTTNQAEGFFSQLKRSIDGTHHHVSAEHLPRYLAEFYFRYSTRKLSDTARMGKLMGQTGGRRLTYKKITD